MALLEVKNLEVYYGVICALKGISFEVNEGEIVSLIGTNGAGKTTMMQSVVGIIPKRSGSIIFDGQDITKTPCHKIVQLGMTQVPEGRRIFQELSVYENLMMGAYTVKDQQQFKEDLAKTIRFIRDEFDMTILLIEHDMNFVSDLCDELTVLSFGTVLSQGDTKAVLQDPKVIKAYIGG
jgi:branched-chain amino acid transport system ATP-binding protein